MQFVGQTVKNEKIQKFSHGKKLAPKCVISNQKKFPTKNQKIVKNNHKKKQHKKTQKKHRFSQNIKIHRKTRPHQASGWVVLGGGQPADSRNPPHTRWRGHIGAKRMVVSVVSMACRFFGEPQTTRLRKEGLSGRPSPRWDAWCTSVVGAFTPSSERIFDVKRSFPLMSSVMVDGRLGLPLTGLEQQCSSLAGWKPQ